MSKRGKSRGRKPSTKPNTEAEQAESSSPEQELKKERQRRRSRSRSLGRFWKGGRRPSTETTTTINSSSSGSNNNNNNSSSSEDEIDISPFVPMLPPPPPPLAEPEPRIDATERVLLEARQRREQRRHRKATLRQQTEGTDREKRERIQATVRASREALAGDNHGDSHGEAEDLRRQVARLRRENRRLDDRALTLESSLGAARESLSRASDDTKTLRVRCSEYEQEVLRGIKELGAAKVESLKELGRVRLAARDERTSLLEKHAAEKQAREDAEAKFRALEEQLSEVSDDLIHELSEQHSSEATARQDAEARCLELESRLKDAEARHQRELAAAAAQQTGDATALQSAEDRCLDLEEKLSASTQKTQELAALLRQKQSKIESLDRELDEVEELREMVIDYETAAARCRELEEEAAGATASRRELEEENRALSQEISDLHAGIFDAELEQKVRTEELEEKLASLGSRCLSLETERDDAEKTNRAVTSENESLQRQIARLESTLAEAQAEGEDRSRERRELDENPETERKSLADREAAETDSLRQKIAELTASLDRAEGDHAAATTELKNLRKEHRELTRRCETLESERDSTARHQKSDHSSTTEELRKALQENESLASRCKSLESEVQQVREQTESERHTLREAQKENTLLSNRCEALASKLTTLEEEMRRAEEPKATIQPTERRSSLKDATTTSVNRTTTPSVRDGISKFERNETGAAENRGGTILRPARGKENDAGRRGHLKDRIGKFQTGSTDATVPGAFQMIGLATLGLKNIGKKEAVENDDEQSDSTSSFFCSGDSSSSCDSSSSSESSLGGSLASGSSHSECGSDDGNNDDDDDVIRVIGPDLALIEISLDDGATTETVGTLKARIAEAAGLPIADLRLGLHTSEGGLGETPLDDTTEVTRGAILAVLPSTVVVHLDERSKLELSVFPGTLIGNIKEYITENTGTPPDQQMLYNLDGHLSKELGDEHPIAADCTLRLSVSV